MPQSQRKRAVFPGQFDPITNGHLDVIRRAKNLFDELIVAVGVNPDKREMFSLDERVDIIRELLGDDSPNVKVEKYTGLTVDLSASIKRQPSCGASGMCRICAMSSNWRWPIEQWAMSRRSSS